MSKRQLFYFIQPEILLDTKRYKIGISQSTKYEFQTLPSNNDDCIKHFTHSNLNGCVTALQSL